MHRHPPHSLPDRAPGPSLPGSRSLTPQTFLDVLSTPCTARKADLLDPPVPNSPLSYWSLLTLTPEPAPPLQTPAATKLAWHCPSQSASQPAPVPCWGVCVLHPGPHHAFPPVCCVRTCEGGEDTPAPSKSPSRSCLSFLQPCGVCKVTGLDFEAQDASCSASPGAQLFLRGGQI